MQCFLGSEGATDVTDPNIDVDLNNTIFLQIVHEIITFQDVIAQSIQQDSKYTFF
jgi:hypothetical protein